MSEHTEIENWILSQFSELTNYGFSKPVLKREDWNTVIDWLGTDLALELELDWKEFDIFFLIVRLENGQLPQGYYVANGKPCRFHLQKVIKERAWSVTLDEMKIISAKGRHRHIQQQSTENLKQRVLAYKAVLMSCVNQLITDSRTIFTT